MAVRVVEINDDGIYAKIFVNGQELNRISGYNITHNVGEVATVELTMVHAVDATLQADVVIKNTETMAKLFDRKQFEDFCKLWEEYHNERKGD